MSIARNRDGTRKCQQEWKASERRRQEKNSGTLNKFESEAAIKPRSGGLRRQWERLHLHEGTNVHALTTGGN